MGSVVWTSAAEIVDWKEPLGPEILALEILGATEALRVMELASTLERTVLFLLFILEEGSKRVLEIVDRLKDFDGTRGRMLDVSETFIVPEERVDMIDTWLEQRFVASSVKSDEFEFEFEYRLIPWGRE